ncbi:MAG: GntR family transcriptional regulator [Propionibacteriaceae bacterium]|jgi:GntR family transcriptional regulator|nr:GntR family transcriptional regulator [Propionibacteriaceae bacterium]
MRVVLSNRSGVPIYEQIKQQVRQAILEGELRADDLLPSIRGLAQDLRVSVITTTRAYRDLEEEGFVVNVQGKGCYVLPRDEALAREDALRKVEDCLAEAIKTARRCGITRAEVAETLDLLWSEDI